VWLHDTLRLIRASDGTPLEIVGTMTDIGQRKSMEEALKRKSERQKQLIKELRQVSDDLRATQSSLVQAERLASLGGLVAGVAHEINTPLGTIVTAASALAVATEQLQQSAASAQWRPSTVRAYLETASQCSALVLANSNRASQLIQSFKQVAVDQTTELRRCFPLHEYLHEIINSLQPHWRPLGASVVIDCDTELQMDSYPGALAQVITNLTINALLHGRCTSGATLIRIEVLALQSELDIHFSDNGPGIPSEHLPKVFDPFFTTRRGQGGTGLGLNIVHNLIVKRFGGTISVCNGPAGGASFRLHIPRVAPEPEAP
jgi:signal transduction histidine kinase